MRAWSGVPLGLGEFRYMDERGDMLGTSKVSCPSVSLHKCRIIPTFHRTDFKALMIGITLESLECLRDTFLYRMVRGRYRNTIVIVPHTHYHRHLHHTYRIEGFKEKAFAGTGISYSTPGYLIPIVRESFTIGKSKIAIYFRGLSKSHKAWDLPCGTGYIAGGIILIYQSLPVSFFIKAMGGKVPAHLSTSAMGFVGYIIICIDACKKLLRCIFAYSHHECLVSVITTTEISFSESMCHSYLWQFLSISKDTKFSLSRKNFSSSCKTTLAAENGYHIILQDLSS